MQAEIKNWIPCCCVGQPFHQVPSFHSLPPKAGAFPLNAPEATGVATPPPALLSVPRNISDASFDPERDPHGRAGLMSDLDGHKALLPRDSGIRTRQAKRDTPLPRCSTWKVPGDSRLIRAAPQMGILNWFSIFNGGSHFEEIKSPGRSFLRNYWTERRSPVPAISSPASVVRDWPQNPLAWKGFTRHSSGVIQKHTTRTHSSVRNLFIHSKCVCIFFLHVLLSSFTRKCKFAHHLFSG